MIRINLLPATARQSKWPINKLLIGTSLLLALVFISIYSYSLFEVWSIEKKLQTTRNQYQALQPTRTLMASANTKQQQLEKKNSILTTLTKERQSWYNIIQHLATQTSSQIWFTDLQKGEKGAIQIKGWANTYPQVAQFMEIMENDQFFTEPILNSVEKDTNAQATKFDIVVKPRRIGP